MTRRPRSVTRDIVFLQMFGVVPAAGVMIGGAFVGGWIATEARIGWAVLAIVLGVLVAFVIIWAACDTVIRTNRQMIEEERTWTSE